MILRNMNLWNRRQRSMFLSLAAMDVAVLLPYVLTWIARIHGWNEFALPALTRAVLASPLALFLTLWFLMLAYMAVIDLLDRKEISSPKREYIVIALVVVTSIVGIRLLLFPSVSIGDLSWIRETASGIFNFTDGVLPPLMLILVNTALWARVAFSTEREMGFFRIGVSLRFGMLLSIIGGAMMTTLGGYSASVAILYFGLFFGFGIFAVAIARIDEKAVGIRGANGAAIPASRIVEIVSYIALIFGVSYALNLLVNPTVIRRVFAFFNPVWSAIGWVLSTVFVAVLLVIGPFIERLMLRLEQIAVNAEPIEMMTGAGLPGERLPVETVTREWVVLRYCLVIGVIVVILALIWFFLLKPDDDKIQLEEDEENTEPDEFVGRVNPQAPRFDRLRDWLAMLKKYGLSRRFLDAISVQNMYANLTREASERGYPRPVSQPPDIYLRTLQTAFPHFDEQLRRITNAYMRAHYGDMTIDREELRAIGEDYQTILESQTT